MKLEHLGYASAGWGGASRGGDPPAHPKTAVGQAPAAVSACGVLQAAVQSWGIQQAGPAGL